MRSRWRKPFKRLLSVSRDWCIKGLYKGTDTLSYSQHLFHGVVLHVLWFLYGLFSWPNT